VACALVSGIGEPGAEVRDGRICEKDEPTRDAEAGSADDEAAAVALDAAKVALVEERIPWAEAGSWRATEGERASASLAGSSCSRPAAA